MLPCSWLLNLQCSILPVTHSSSLSWLLSPSNVITLPVSCPLLSLPYHHCLDFGMFSVSVIEWFYRSELLALSQTPTNLEDQLVFYIFLLFNLSVQFHLQCRSLVLGHLPKYKWTISPTPFPPSNVEFWRIKSTFIQGKLPTFFNIVLGGEGDYAQFVPLKITILVLNDSLVIFWMVFTSVPTTFALHCVIPENIHTPPPRMVLQFKPPHPPGISIPEGSWWTPHPPGISMFFFYSICSLCKFLTLYA